MNLHPTPERDWGSRVRKRSPQSRIRGEGVTGERYVEHGAWGLLGGLPIVFGRNFDSALKVGGRCRGLLSETMVDPRISRTGNEQAVSCFHPSCGPFIQIDHYDTMLSSHRCRDRRNVPSSSPAVWAPSKAECHRQDSNCCMHAYPCPQEPGNVERRIRVVRFFDRSHTVCTPFDISSFVNITGSGVSTEEMKHEVCVVA